MVAIWDKQCHLACAYIFAHLKDVFNLLKFGEVGMNQRSRKQEESDEAQANIVYIRQMLGQLQQVARKEGAEMLSYLIEMAYLEAGDLQTGRKQLSRKHRD